MEFLTLENFLWLQAGLVILGAIYILRRASAGGGMRMRWQRSGRILPEEMARPTEMWGGPATKPRGTTSDRSLNVHFNFNGHSWDAYEALGLPAGAGLEKAEAAYAQAVSKMEPGSKEFYDHALDAIRRHLKSD